MRKFVILLTTAVLVVGCNSKEKVITDNDKVNKWVHQTMKENYLWSYSLSDYQRSTLSPDDYLEQMRYRDNVNVELRYDYYGDRFSQIERSGAASRMGDFASSSDDYINDFGFGFISVVDSYDRVVYCQVAYVVPGSPADMAGVKRGYNFSAMQVGQTLYPMPMSKTTFAAVYDNLTVKFGFHYPEVSMIELTRASYEDNPIIFDSVYNTGSTKTAYLVYNHFSSGYNNGFNQDLNDVFVEFKQKGATNLVLDLRYNGGGELSCALLLGSLIARTGDLGKPFVYLERNKHRNTSYTNYDLYRFSSSVGANNLNVQKLYILTLGWSASASELVLHCLKPYFQSDLQHVGTMTYGKNVGSNAITNSSYEWKIIPITMRVHDKDGVSGYESGIETGSGFPNTYLTGEDYVVNSEYIMYDFGELGNNKEKMLASVMYHIENGSWPVLGRSSEDSSSGVVEGLRKEFSGARVNGLMEEPKVAP